MVRIYETQLAVSVARTARDLGLSFLSPRSFRQKLVTNLRSAQLRRFREIAAVLQFGNGIWRSALYTFEIKHLQFVHIEAYGYWFVT